MKIFTRQLRTLLIAVVAAVGAVGLAGCGDDSGANSGGGGGSYESVTIGGLRWMKKNLNVKTADSWCYDDKSSNCNKYGRLYTWAAAKSACESVGWRLPTSAEWGELAKAAGGTGTYGDGGTAGKKLKAKSGWNSNGNGTDDYGFSALPGGTRCCGGRGFALAGETGHWWTATGFGMDEAFLRGMTYDTDNVYNDWEDKSNGWSVRCVK